jgi:hypothetical protein
MAAGRRSSGADSTSTSASSGLSSSGLATTDATESSWLDGESPRGDPPKKVFQMGRGGLFSIRQTPSLVWGEGYFTRPKKLNLNFEDRI